MARATVAKNYYVVLGVPRTETLSGIRTAYRGLAKRFHPDLAGDAATRAFQDIVEAYEVLSDPERRLAYDRELDDNRRAPDDRPTDEAIVQPIVDTVPIRVDLRGAQAARSRSVEPLAAHPSRVEPLIPNPPPKLGRRRTLWWVLR